MVPKNAHKPPNFKRLLVPKRAHLHWAQDQGGLPTCLIVDPRKACKFFKYLYVVGTQKRGSEERAGGESRYLLKWLSRNGLQ